MKINKKVRNAIRYLIMLFALVVFGYASYELTDIYLSYAQSSEAYSDVSNQFMVPVIGDIEMGEPETDENGIVISNGDVGLDFVFDFAALKRMNKDAVGWMKLGNGDYINYPVVQGKDNEFYLKHLIDRRWNVCGTLFIDYRCKDAWESKHVIVYGHRMKDLSMFGMVARYVTRTNFHKQNPYFDIWCGETHYRYYVYAMFQDDALTTGAYQLEFESDEEFMAYIAEHKEKSKYKVDIEILPTDKIVTLSTCVEATGYERYIVQLVRREVVE